MINTNSTTKKAVPRFIVADITARTALTKQKDGDMCYVTANKKHYVWNTAQWEMIDVAIENWVGETYYSAGELVKINDVIYQYHTSRVSGFAFDSLENGFLNVVSNYTSPGAYIPGIYVPVGKMIEVSGKIIRKNTAGVGFAFNNAEKATWTLVTSNVIATYSSTEYYWAGETVFIPATQAILRVTVSGVQDPLPSTLQFMSQVKDMPYTPSTYYFERQTVTENGLRYQRITAGTSGTVSNMAADPSESSNWYVTSQLDLPVGSTGQTKTASYTVSATDGVVRVVPTVATTVTLPATLPNNKVFTFTGIVDTTKPVTFLASGGATIVSPVTYTAVASFVMPGVTGQHYSLQLMKTGIVWSIT